jgi:5-methylcytosine-specific restriction endonuclease McrA
MGWESPEKRRIYDQQRYWANPAKTHARCKRYYANHAEAICAKHRANHAANPKKAVSATRRWRQKHPEAHRAEVRARKARKKNAPINDLTHMQWLEIQEAQQHRCYYCGKRCKGRLTQDHITPLSKGGSHTLHNVIAACASCNNRKKANPPPIPVQPFLLTLAPAKKKAS